MRARTVAFRVLLLRGYPLVLGCALLLSSACQPRRGRTGVRLPAGQRLAYQVRLEPGLRRAQVRLALPAAARGRVLRLPRVAGWQARRWRIARVQCDGQRLVRDGDRGWPLPAGCRRLRWQVRLAPVPPSGYRAFSLMAAYHPTRRWAFLPGAGTLLEVAGVRGPATLRLLLPPGLRAHHALDRRRDGTLQLPRAPLSHQALVGVGPFVVSLRAVAGVRVRHRFDGPPPQRFTALLAAHEKGLRYLVGVFGAPRWRRLDAWWFGLGPGARIVSGYAGQRSVAISYVQKAATAPHLTAELLPWLPLVMLLHEQVHQLGVARPAWLSESLAQYYALKALGRAGVLSPAAHGKATDRITRPWSRMPAADAKVALLPAHRRYLRTGSLGAYRVFYTNGARFWRDVDRAIVRKSGGRRSLDSVVRRLLRLPYGRRGAPPSAFVRLLVREGGADLKRWVRQRVLGQ